MAGLVFGLCGYASAGKDALAKALVEERGWTRISFADPLREMLLRLNPMIPLHVPGAVSVIRLSVIVRACGWDFVKRNYPEVRELLQRLGTECVRELLGQDTWVKVAAQKIAETNTNCIITDVRFLNECEICDFVIRVHRKEVEPVNGHISDNLDFQVDATFENNIPLDESRKRFLLLIDTEVPNVRRDVDSRRLPYAVAGLPHRLRR